MYSSPEVFDGIVKNIVPLYSLVMSKHHSLVELLSSNNDDSCQDELQMKTKICPPLPHLQTTNIYIYIYIFNEVSQYSR